MARPKFDETFAGFDHYLHQWWHQGQIFSPKCQTDPSGLAANIFARIYCKLFGSQTGIHCNIIFAELDWSGKISKKLASRCQGHYLDFSQFLPHFGFPEAICWGKEASEEETFPIWLRSKLLPQVLSLYLNGAYKTRHAFRAISISFQYQSHSR